MLDVQVKVYNSDNLMQVSSSNISQNLLLSLTETHQGMHASYRSQMI